MGAVKVAVQNRSGQTVVVVLDEDGDQLADLRARAARGDVAAVDVVTDPPAAPAKPKRSPRPAAD